MMTNKSFFILFVLTLSVSMKSAYCQFPRGCEVTGFSYIDNRLMLNETGNQTFYLIQNKSDATILLTRHETKNVFMSPNLKKTLEPKRWAAFASDEQNMHFNCLEKQNDSLVSIDCRETLEVCQYPRVKFALSNMGNYWVAANMSKNQVMKEAIAKGILLHW